jgi:hypothetical protein
VSCNPVRQVLKDKAKLDEVAKEVIKQGYCANDTLTIVKSDTIVKVDSLIEVYTDTTFINDTAYVTMWKNKNYTTTFIVHDTLHSVVVDNARIKQYQAYVEDLSKQVSEHKQNSTHRLYWFIIACAIILFLVLYKIR